MQYGSTEIAVKSHGSGHLDNVPSQAVDKETWFLFAHREPISMIKWAHFLSGHKYPWDPVISQIEDSHLVSFKKKAQAGLELTSALCLSLPTSRITDLGHHNWF